MLAGTYDNHSERLRIALYILRETVYPDRCAVGLRGDPSRAC